MRVIALISGGKDSILNISKCLDDGNHIVANINLYSKEFHPTDSYMFQTTGSTLVPAISKAMQVELLQMEIQGKDIIKYQVIRLK